MPKPVLMSFQPQWAKSILLDGTRYELRRTRCGCQTGTPVVVYTSQVKKVTGTFIAGNVLAAHPDSLWRQVGGHCGVSREDFAYYLHGCKTAYAIEVVCPRTVTPIDLGFRGPMSFQYLDSTRAEHARVLAHVSMR
jgi:predicted transcriptional regulator